LPRHCPFCERDTIVGHGRRRKQAHDDKHDWIWVRRGRCLPCKKTFTVVPVWSPPSGHYSYECRRQVCDAVANGKPAPHCRDSMRLPDDSTVRRWSWCKFISMLCGLVMSRWPVRANFFSAPTILAWDFPAASRILRLEANSP
jgi:transposase-like protein